jgi:hypothetical protein
LKSLSSSSEGSNSVLEPLSPLLLSLLVSSSISIFVKYWLTRVYNHVLICPSVNTSLCSSLSSELSSLVFSFNFATLATSLTCTTSTTLILMAMRLPRPFSSSSSIREKSPTLISSSPLILISWSLEPLGLRLNPIY